MAVTARDTIIVRTNPLPKMPGARLTEMPQFARGKTELPIRLTLFPMQVIYMDDPGRIKWHKYFKLNYTNFSTSAVPDTLR